jgi:nucleotide-binding universal stress UspA family protein
MYTHILIPTDGSELADKALQHGIEAARLFGARVTVVRVTPPPQPLVLEGVVLAYPTEDLRRQIKASVDATFERVDAAAKAAGVSCSTRHVEHEQPWQAIIAAAKEGGCDLIVMASHGRRGVSALVLGSETQKVLTHTTIPVLVYR